MLYPVVSFPEARALEGSMPSGSKISISEVTGKSLTSIPEAEDKSSGERLNRRFDRCQASTLQRIWLAVNPMLDSDPSNNSVSGSQ